MTVETLGAEFARVTTPQFDNDQPFPPRVSYREIEQHDAKRESVKSRVRANSGEVLSC